MFCISFVNIRVIASGETVCGHTYSRSESIHNTGLPLQIIIFIQVIYMCTRRQFTYRLYDTII